MKLGGRIAIYILVCALWAGFLLWAAGRNYYAAQVRLAREAEYNQALLHRNEIQAKVTLAKQVLAITQRAQERSYAACMKRDHADPSMCEKVAEADAELARLRAAQP